MSEKGNAGEGEEGEAGEEGAAVVELDKDAWDVDARLLSFVNNEAYAVATQSGSNTYERERASHANSGSRQAHIAACIFLDEFMNEATKRALASKRTIQREFKPESLYFAILRYVSVQKNLDHLMDYSEAKSSSSSSSSPPKMTTSKAFEPENLRVPPRLQNYLQFVFGRDFSNRDCLLKRYLSTALKERSLLS